ncbi:hypothetical protein DFH11DRAFT_1621532 [Phellopilus nigrolimitatus]|nr:hypothetical protein DFH11DRAFT_1621532 [Phellopilus nigrolimitatus]
MGPVRASASNNQIGNSSFASTDRESRKKRDSNPYNGGNLKANDDASDLPGVQKLKSALRQTRRLLEKDTLAADVRVETERRLRALEADLETAVRNRKERTLATKYHKVKFFERKKVSRKIKQVKKELAAAEADSSASSKKAPTQLEHALFELRVDLHYILVRAIHRFFASSTPTSRFLPSYTSFISCLSAACSRLSEYQR